MRPKSRSSAGTASRIELVDPRSNGIARNRLPFSLDAPLVHDTYDLLGRRPGLGKVFLLNDLGDEALAVAIELAATDPDTAAVRNQCGRLAGVAVPRELAISGADTDRHVLPHDFKGHPSCCRRIPIAIREKNLWVFASA